MMAGNQMLNSPRAHMLMSFMIHSIIFRAGFQEEDAVRGCLALESDLGRLPGTLPTVKQCAGYQGALVLSL